MILRSGTQGRSVCVVRFRYAGRPLEGERRRHWSEVLIRLAGHEENGAGWRSPGDDPVSRARAVVELSDAWFTADTGRQSAPRRTGAAHGGRETGSVRHLGQPVRRRRPRCVLRTGEPVL